MLPGAPHHLQATAPCAPGLAFTAHALLPTWPRSPACHLHACFAVRTLALEAARPWTRVLGNLALPIASLLPRPGPGPHLLSLQAPRGRARLL